MKLLTQKRISANLLKCGVERVYFNPKYLESIKEAITKSDIRLLISDNVIVRIPKKGVSRVRARKIATQKRKGLRKGKGSKKGTLNATITAKRRWINKVRIQRQFLKELKDKDLLVPGVYRNLYMKSKGGFFRSKRHIQLYIGEHNLINKKED